MCSVKASQSRPRAATNEVHCVLHEPGMKCTLRDRRSSLGDQQRAPCRFALERGRQSGRSSNASCSRAGLHVPGARIGWRTLRQRNASISCRCAGQVPSPLRPCSRVLTLTYPMAAGMIHSSGRGRNDRPIDVRRRPSRSDELHRRSRSRSCGPLRTPQGLRMRWD